MIWAEAGPGEQLEEINEALVSLADLDKEPLALPLELILAF
jgi:hypothetical protein